MDRLPAPCPIGPATATAAGWDPGTHRRDAIGRWGLDPLVLAAEAQRDADARAVLIADNEQAQVGAGHCDVRTFMFEGKALFGQGGIELLPLRLRQHGLRPRATDPSCTDRFRPRPTQRGDRRCANP